MKIPNPKFKNPNKLQLPISKLIRKPSYGLILYHLVIGQLNIIGGWVLACLRLPAGRQGRQGIWLLK
jgi:hypothetical protein